MHKNDCNYSFMTHRAIKLNYELQLHFLIMDAVDSRIPTFILIVRYKYIMNALLSNADN